jgi:hypothetical protein
MEPPFIPHVEQPPRMRRRLLLLRALLLRLLLLRALLLRLLLLRPLDLRLLLLRPLDLRFFLRVLRLVFLLGFLGIKSTASWLLLISIEPSII